MKSISNMLDPVGFLFIVIFLIMGIGFGYRVMFANTLQSVYFLEDKINE
jgi:hypothetical protein